MNQSSIGGETQKYRNSRLAVSQIIQDLLSEQVPFDDAALTALRTGAQMDAEEIHSLVKFCSETASEFKPGTAYVCTGLVCALNGAEKLALGLENQPALLGSDVSQVETSPRLGRCFAAPVVCYKNAYLQLTLHIEETT